MGGVSEFNPSITPTAQNRSLVLSEISTNSGGVPEDSKIVAPDFFFVFTDLLATSFFWPSILPLLTAYFIFALICFFVGAASAVL